MTPRPRHQDRFGYWADHSNRVLTMADEDFIQPPGVARELVEGVVDV